MSTKFKVGDRVLIKEGNFANRIGIITEVMDAENRYYIKIDGRASEILANEQFLEYADSEDLRFFKQFLPTDESGRINTNDEAFFEMAMIAYEEKLNISVNQETKHLSIAYFKIYDHQKYSAAGRVARLHFKDSGMEYHDDSRGKIIWELNASDSQKVVDLMRAPNDEHEGYTNWQVACYQWNYHNGLVKNFKDYFAGKYDEKYRNIADSSLREAYVPHDQEMPEEWIYDKSKGKHHR